MKNKILVIEDDADINTLLKKILERAGYEAETAFPAQKAGCCLS